MFKAGEYVVHGGDGVCVIKSISQMCFYGKNTREYYCLESLGKNSAVCFVPLSACKSLRPIMDKEDFEKLWADWDKIETIPNQNIKLKNNLYKEEIKKRTCEGYIRLLKTIAESCQNRKKSGKTISATDERFWGEAFDSLKYEMSVSLGITAEEAADKISRRFNVKNLIKDK